MEVISLTDVLAYKLSSNYPVEGWKKAGLTDMQIKGAKRSLRQKAKRFNVIDGRLVFNTGKHHLHNKEAVLTKVEKTAILKACHDGRNHPGRDRTIEVIKERYFWDSMQNDVASYLNSCPKCQKANPDGFRKNAPQLHPIPVTSSWYHVEIDLVFLPESFNGNRVCLTLVDLFSKWPEAVALPDKTGLTIAKALYTIFLRMGFPVVISSDQGREFVNCILDNLARVNQVERRVSSAYHPQSQGLVERFNQTLKRALMKTCNDESHRDWDQFLDEVLYSYRTVSQQSSKYKPFELMFGRTPLPGDASITNHPTDLGEPSESDIGLAAAALAEKRQQLWSNAKANIDTAQQKQKVHYDAKHRLGTSFKINDWVLLHNSRKASRQGSRMEDSWKGPYVIAKDFGRNVFGLATTRGTALQRKYNACVLKPYKQRSLSDIDMSYDMSTTINAVQALCAISTVETKVFTPINVAWQMHQCEQIGIPLVRSHTSIADTSPLGPPTHVEEMQGDGNCWFRAISYAVCGSETYHPILRDIVVRYMHRKGAEIESYFGDRYIQNSNVVSDGVWATDAEILATAGALATDIHVYCMHGDKMEWACYEASTFGVPDQHACNLYISNTAGNHFDFVLATV